MDMFPVDNGTCSRDNRRLRLEGWLSYLSHEADISSAEASDGLTIYVKLKYANN